MSDEVKAWTDDMIAEFATGWGSDLPWLEQQQRWVETVRQLKEKIDYLNEALGHGVPTSLPGYRRELDAPACLAALANSARAWEPRARLVGNVQAGDIAAAIGETRARIADLEDEKERQRVQMAAELDAAEADVVSLKAELARLHATPGGRLVEAAREVLNDWLARRVVGETMPAPIAALHGALAAKAIGEVLERADEAAKLVSVAGDVSPRVVAVPDCEGWWASRYDGFVRFDGVGRDAAGQLWLANGTYVGMLQPAEWYGPIPLPEGWT